MDNANVFYTIFGILSNKNACHTAIDLYPSLSILMTKRNAFVGNPLNGTLVCMIVTWNVTMSYILLVNIRVLKFALVSHLQLGIRLVYLVSLTVHLFFTRMEAKGRVAAANKTSSGRLNK